MTYSRFEDLPVWNEAVRLVEGVYALCDEAKEEFRKRSGLKNQLERAALSVSNNIAEGFERGTTKEPLTFLYIARGSAGEVRSMLCLMERLKGFAHFKSQISDLKSQSEGCAMQLRGWAGNLQESDIKGQRHLTERSKEELGQARARERDEKERDEFLQEIGLAARQSRGF